MIKNKKGEEGSGLSMGQIIIIILLITCVAVILFWWFQIYKPIENLNPTTCHNSIIMRHTANIGGTGLGIDAIPLQCKTEYVCYSRATWWTKIKDWFKSDKAIEIEKKRAEDAGKTWECPDSYKKIQVSSKNEIIKDLVEKEALWWSIVGEGKMDYNPKNWDWKLTSTYCMMGEQIQFDASIWNDERLNKIKYGEIWDYMEKNNVPNKNINYLEYFYGIKTKKQLEEWAAASFEINNPSLLDEIYIDTSQSQFIVTSMSKDTWWNQIAIGAGGAAAIPLVIITAPIIGTIGSGIAAFIGLSGISAASLTTGTAGVAAFIYSLKGDKNQFEPPYITSAAGLNFEKCNNFDTLASPPNDSA